MNTTWHFYLSPATAWAAMYQDCAAATQSIFLEQYIFEDDAIGRKFMRLFIHQTSRGVHIQILCDEVGSRTLCASPLVAELRAKGDHIHFYNSLRWIDLLKPRRIFPRTHIKTLVIDATIAFVGGVCICQRMENWRDTQIRITGPVVQSIEKTLSYNFNGTPITEQNTAVATADFTYLQSDPKFFRHPIYEAILHAINDATNYVYMSSAFFVPSRRLHRAMEKATSRGVSVILLIPTHSDSRLADLACLSYAMKLLKSGVLIFRYHPTILHSKTVISDGNWGTIGSSNMDMLSFFHNREANIFITNKEALAEMKRDFLNDIENSIELNPQAIDHLPLWEKIAIHMARLLHSLL